MKIKKKKIALLSGFIAFRSGLEIHWSLSNWALPFGLEFVSGLIFIRFLCLEIIF